MEDLVRVMESTRDGKLRISDIAVKVGLTHNRLTKVRDLIIAVNTEWAERRDPRILRIGDRIPPTASDAWVTLAHDRIKSR